MSENIYDTPASSLEKDTVYCRECGNKLSRTAQSCERCGAEQSIEG
ncbi:MAG: zinc-ribbon domain-containing protein [Candidatus Thiodiazotropha sp. L084R]